MSLSPFLAILWALWSGGAVIPCSQKMTFTVNQPTDQGEIWQFTCSDRWSEDSSLHFVPAGATTITANCYSNPLPTMKFNVYNRRGKYLYSVSSGLTQIIWICNNDPKKFDSTFNVASENVATSPYFWALFSLALGGGMYVGAVKMSISSVQSLLTGGEKDD